MAPSQTRQPWVMSSQECPCPWRTEQETGTESSFLRRQARGSVSVAPWKCGQNSATWARLEAALPARPVWWVLTGAETRTPHCLLLIALASNLILWSTENSLLTVPLGPSEESNKDTLDKLRQAVSERQSGGRAGRGALLCKVLTAL